MPLSLFFVHPSVGMSHWEDVHQRLPLFTAPQINVCHCLQANIDPHQTPGADRACYVIDMNHPAKMQIPLLACLPA